MRWMFLWLIVLNLFYYVWHQQQAPMHATEIAPMASIQQAKRDIKLLSESGVPRRREEMLEDKKADACLFLGRFDAQGEAGSVEQRLLSLDIDSSVQAIDAAADVDYWVYLPPLASREASLRQLRELQARAIDSYVITQGDLANGISLGIFPKNEAAQGVMRRLHEAGYEPLLRELKRAHRSYWVRIAPQSQRLLDESLLQRLALDFKGLEHQLMPCEGVATEL